MFFNAYFERKRYMLFYCGKVIYNIKYIKNYWPQDPVSSLVCLLNPVHTLVNSFVIKLFSNCLILHSISCWDPKYKTRTAKNLFKFIGRVHVFCEFLASAQFPVGLLSLSSQRGSWICKQSSYKLNNNNNPLSITYVENIFLKSVWPFKLYSWDVCDQNI